MIEYIEHVSAVIDYAELAKRDVDLFEGPEVDKTGVPDNAVFVAEYNGTATPLFGGADGKDIFERNVQILVRNDSYEACQRLAEKIFKVVHKQAPAGHGYAGWLATTPRYLGQSQDKDRHRWSVNMTITYKE